MPSKTSDLVSSSTVEQDLDRRRRRIADDLEREREALRAAIQGLRPTIDRADRVRRRTHLVSLLVPVVLSSYGVGRAWRSRSGFRSVVVLAVETWSAIRLMRRAVRAQA